MPPPLPPLHPATDVHPSHVPAAEPLAAYRDALGPADPTLHIVARSSIERASKEDPAAHLLFTYWILSEATGKSERTLMRHLVEDGHPWSPTVRRLVNVRHNPGELKTGEGFGAFLRDAARRLCARGCRGNPDATLPPLLSVPPAADEQMPTSRWS